MAHLDSPAVAAIRARMEAIPRDGSDWSARMRKNYAANIRTRRLIEAREKGQHNEMQWLELVAEFASRCVLCGCTPDGGPCKDHIKPIYQGGADSIDNLQPLCRQCNSAKGADSFNWVAYRRESGFEASE